MLQRDELELLNSRVTLVLGLILVAFGVLAFGFWNHQIARSSYFREQAERNRIRDIRLVAPRGAIYDREGRLIADSRPSFNLILTRENSTRSVEDTIDLLADGIETTREEMLRRVEPYRATPDYEPILLAMDLSLPERAFVEARQYELSEISLELSPRRRYELGETAAHLVGYVGEITPGDLKSGEFEGLDAGDLVGQSGLERFYDGVLQGQDGIRRVIVNNRGREMGLLGEASPVPGHDLVTTIDLDLQRAAEDALGERTGVAVAIAPATGEVLALASLPGFDPTIFARGIRQNEWNGLISDPRKPLRNRAIQDRYSPGSVFKIFMAAAALEEEEIDLTDTVFCPGYTVLYGNRFDCWRGSGHGAMTLHDALVHSCNVFFYGLGDRLGIDRISDYATRMGLGRASGIDLPGEDQGLIPSPAWKLATSDTRWFPGETISVSIGQGAVSVTPLQLTWAVGGLVAGGRLAQPRLVDPERIRSMGLEAPEFHREDYPVRQGTVDVLRQALWDVVNEGTGTRARVQGIGVGGKSGTAQVVAKDRFEGQEALADHAWFVGFAPYDQPEIVVGVFVENGGGGGAAAAPVAQAIMQVYFDKKRGLFTRTDAIETEMVRLSEP